MMKSNIVIDGYAYLHDAVVHGDHVTGIFLMTEVPKDRQLDTHEIWIETRFDDEFSLSILGLMHYLDKGLQVMVEIKAHAIQTTRAVQNEGSETIYRLHVEAKLHCIGNIYVDGQLLENSGNHIMHAKKA